MNPKKNMTVNPGSLAARFGLLLFLGIGVWLAGTLSAQAPARKPPKEEEEEAPAKVQPRPPLRVEDEPEPRRRNAPPAAAPLPADLAVEAERAEYSAVRDLFRQLAVPHDVVFWNFGVGKSIAVEPFPRLIEAGTEYKGTMRFVPLDDKRKAGPPLTASRSEVRAIEPFENSALQAVRKFLDPKGPTNALPRFELLQAAERALGAVVRYHESARQRGQREGDGWNPVLKALRAELLTIQLELLGTIELKDWDSALALTTRLSEATAKPEVHLKLAQHMSRFVTQPLGQGDFAVARQRLKLLDEVLPNNAMAGTVSDRLARTAAELFDRARAEKDQSKALALLTTAENLWPRLPGLRDYRLRLSKDYPVLLVGVHALPENLSPATACTDSERYALDLIFESLVKPVQDPNAGQRYDPCLASDQPRLIPLGREFHLCRDAYWSNGAPVTAVDVRRTVQLLREAGRADLLDGARPGSDPFHVAVTLRQGFIDPLSLMTFKVLPDSTQLQRPDDPRFAKQPVGSGPYRFQGRDKDQAVFQANHNYRRSDKIGLPRIREVRFFHSKKPEADFSAGRLHLLLEPVAVAQVQSVPRVTVHHLPARRIYFLAVNHRKPALQNQDLRRALALALDRTKILNDVFRADFPEAHLPHSLLNGPYPLGSWAAKPELKPDLYNPDLAKLLAEKAATAKHGVKLTLKYPDDDARVRKACEAIADQVRALGIEIRLEPRSPPQLRQAVEVDHDYELAYYSHDYESEAYLLWPLFDPKATGPGGRNYLGYPTDSELQSWFQKALDHREFAKVREFTHAVHALFNGKMPFIPLWKLDIPIALLADLKTFPEPAGLDPLSLFADVERWELGRRP